jgi:transposase InsO family protein
MSERRACRLIKADRMTVRYRSRRPRDDALRGRLRELAAEQRRFGYRRLHILLRAEGHVLNRKKTQRLYREEGLTVRKRKGRKRATGMRAPILVEARPNAPWSVDFVHDQLSNGRRFRILNVIDDVTKECLVAIADTSISRQEGGARTRHCHRPARQTRSDHLRPWNRVPLQRYARLGSKHSDRLAFHCPGKTDAERDLRGVQRPHA